MIVMIDEVLFCSKKENDTQKKLVDLVSFVETGIAYGTYFVGVSVDVSSSFGHRSYSWFATQYSLD